METTLNTIAFVMPGGTEWIVLLVLGLLIFGRRLPEVGRSLGRGIVEFKKGVRGIEEEIDDASRSGSLPASTPASSLPADTPGSLQQETAREREGDASS